jgi:hypothetical protein
MNPDQPMIPDPIDPDRGDPGPDIDPPAPGQPDSIQV